MHTTYDVYANHKCTRIIPLWSLLPALFSKLPARRRGTVRIQTGAYTHAARLTHTCDPPVLGSHVRSHVHLPPQRHAAIPCGRTLDSPGRPYVEEATLFFSSSFTGPPPAGPTFPLSIGEHLVERAASSNRISKSLI